MRFWSVLWKQEKFMRNCSLGNLNHTNEVFLLLTSLIGAKKPLNQVLNFIDGDFLDIVFTNHVIERKTERADYLVRTPTIADTRRSVPELEKLLREKGIWYSIDDEEEGLTKFFCIVNQLEVYCGLLIDEDGSELILMTTYWPYNKRMKTRLFPRGKPQYSRYFLPD